MLPSLEPNHPPIPCPLQPGNQTAVPPPPLWGHTGAGPAGHHLETDKLPTITLG